VQGPGLQPALSSQTATNDNDPASQDFYPASQDFQTATNDIDPASSDFDPASQDFDPASQDFNHAFPIQLLSQSQDQNENQAAGQPATFDETFLTEIDNFLAICGDEPTPDVSDVPSITEEEFLETYLTNGGSSSPQSCSSSLENIPSVVSADGGALEETLCDAPNVETLHDAPNVEAVPMEVDITRVLDNYLVPSPTPVSAPFSIPIDTDGDIRVVSHFMAAMPVQFSPAPSAPLRSKTVIMQGPALAARLSTTEAQHGKTMQSPRVKKVAKTNAERCELYRTRQKTKKEKGEEELRRLQDKNKELKAKEAALRNKVKRMREAALRMGLKL